ncbi:MAG: OmpA family protein [Thiothrix sp.]|nr:OmpA family protein [Thiothrix sp.]HPE60885.1 OmpA family protein [Thiolinea sp.]
MNPMKPFGHVLPYLLAIPCLLADTMALADTIHLQGKVVNSLSREALGKVDVQLLRDNELLEQQFLNTGSLFDFKLTTDERSRYTLRVKHADYPEQQIDISSALEAETLPEQLTVSLGDPAADFVFSSRVLDRDTLKPIPETRIRSTNRQTGEHSETRTDHEGSYHLDIRAGHDYDILVYNRDYLKRNARISYCNDSLEQGHKYCFSGFTSVSLNPDGGVTAATTTNLLDRVEIGKRFRVDNIYYDYNKATLRADALPNLDKVHHILTDNPQLIVELGSHADSRGSDAYNLSLSQKRAESAVDYIIGTGIVPARISAKGYGESRLLNHCSNDVKCSDAEHEANRRTEFTIIAIDETAIED